MNNPMAYKRKADHGLTPNDVPDPTPLPKIAGPYLLVRPVALKESDGEAKIGSIILTENYVEDVESINNVGKVLVVGDLAYHEPAKDTLRYGRNWCKTGDYVVWGKGFGKKLTYKGVKCVVLTDDEVLMVVDDPKDIDPHKNLVKY